MTTNCNPFDSVELDTKIYVSCIGSILAALTYANMLLSAYCIIKTSCFRSNNSIPKTFVVLFYCICFFFCSSGTLWSIHIVMSYMCASSYTVWIGIGIGGDTAYRYGLATLFLLYVARLHQSFRNTNLAVSGAILAICFVAFIVQLIIPVLTHYFFSLGDWVSGLRCVYSQIFINTIFASFLLILFAHKLIELGRKTRLPQGVSAEHFSSPSATTEVTPLQTSDMNPATTIANCPADPTTAACTTELTCTVFSTTTSTTWTPHETHAKDVCKGPSNAIKVVHYQIDALSPAIKYMICATVSIVSSNLISSFIIIRSEGYDSERMWITSMLSAVVDEFINLLFLYLQFPMGNTLYWKCCTKWHVCCMDQLRVKTSKGDSDCYI
eukprot:479024_1